MTITDVEALHLRLPGIEEIADGTQDVLVIRIHTDAGLVGLLRGQDPLDVEGLWGRVPLRKSFSKQEPSIVFWAKPAIYGSPSNFGSSLNVSKSVFATEPLCDLRA